MKTEIDTKELERLREVERISEKLFKALELMKKAYDMLFVNLAKGFCNDYHLVLTEAPQAYADAKKDAQKVLKGSDETRS